MNGLDLFSGIGGISLALEPWVKTIAYCEQDRYAQGVLLSRMRDGLLDTGPIWDDVRTLSHDQFIARVDIIFGGFPCQDLSTAGRGAGLEGERSGLFFEIIRLTRELRPSFIFLENVPAIVLRGLERVLLEFAALGYDCRWTIVSAAELGACHRRERWFLLAYADSERLRIESNGFTERETPTESQLNGIEKHSPDSDGTRLQGEWRRESRITRPVVYNGWKSEPTICRGVNGVQHRVDRIKCLGNSVVPLAAREAFQRLSGLRS